ncbi:hypothetical protein [Saccharopolyspora karakumensis]|uniref:hypothetical protein n=1 Tax=Saccharopolyspora karakumensis TaxID=2530386 RepID=UPI0014052369|nr:hypothetical protein [Saccharopolyspora karakumensis]
MTESQGPLDPIEDEIAQKLAIGFDNIARLMTGPVSDQYFHEKFPRALRAFQEVAGLLGLDTYDPGVVIEDAPKPDLLKVWDEVVRRESSDGRALDQIWTAVQYENPYYVAQYPLSDNKPYFGRRPRTLDDPTCTDWHVQYGTQDSFRLTNAVVRGRSASDAVRNAYYLYPEATKVRINILKHPDET